MTLSQNVKAIVVSGTSLSDLESVYTQRVGAIVANSLHPVNQRFIFSLPREGVLLSHLQWFHE